MNNLYNITIYIYISLIRISAIFNSKSRLWIEGRKNTFYKLKKEFANSYNVVWFHCSSLGEFEQGKSVIYAYQKKYPNHNILLHHATCVTNVNDKIKQMNFIRNNMK